MPDQRIRLVCFDLGGVLLRICRTWAEACVAAGLDLRAGVDPCACGEEWEHVNMLYQTGCIPGDEFALRVSTLIQRIYSAPEVGRIHDAWILGEYQGAAKLVDDLHFAGLETAALSNTCHEHWLCMPRFEVIRKIRYKLGSHQLGVCKPDPKAYAEVEQRTGWRDGQIIFFDDLAENIAAAGQRGWHTKRIDPDGCTVSQMREALGDHLALRQW